MPKRGGIVRCPYCGTKFKHTGKIELQKCPKCKSELLC
jgi:predicted Zn-ribbon and HTH transcriptional regulator